MLPRNDIFHSLDNSFSFLLKFGFKDKVYVTLYNSFIGFLKKQEEQMTPESEKRERNGRQKDE